MNIWRHLHLFTIQFNLNLTLILNTSLTKLLNCCVLLTWRISNSGGSVNRSRKPETLSSSAMVTVTTLTETCYIIYAASNWFLYPVTFIIPGLWMAVMYWHYSFPWPKHMGEVECETYLIQTRDKTPNCLTYILKLLKLNITKGGEY